DLASIRGVGRLALITHMGGHALTVTTHDLRSDALDNPALNRPTRRKHIARLSRTGLSHQRAAVRLNGDDTLQSQALQRRLNVVAVGFQGINDLGFDKTGT